MRQNVLNVVLFVVLAAGVGWLYWYAEANWFPKKPKPDPNAIQAKKQPEPAPDAAKTQPPPTVEPASPEAVAAVVGGPAARGKDAPAPAITPPPPTPAKVEAKLTPRAPSKPPTLIQLGDSTFYNQILLTTRGGAVQQVVLPRFDEADRLGRERKTPEGKPYPLYLVPGVSQPLSKFLENNPPIPDLTPGKAADPADLSTPAQRRPAEPSYALFHYPAPEDKSPVTSLGDMDWNIPGGWEKDESGTSKPRVLSDGRHEVIFEAELGEPHFIKIRKTYTLSPKDYHAGLKIDFERLPGGQKGKGVFRYQIAGAHGLPVEGEWYTSTYRIALIGWADSKGSDRRQYEDSTAIGLKRGGEVVSRVDKSLRYICVATQYFASALAVDDSAPDNVRSPWAYARATTELPFDRPADPNKPYLDDITVRAVAEPLDLAAGEKVTHQYLIYNGPAKVRLLGLLSGEDRAVDPALVNRYLYQIGLRTITDYRSPTFIGAVADALYWTDIVIVFTNLMHEMLWAIHYVVGSWGMSIIVLTIMVRLLLFFPSRKQTQMNLKMMEVQKKLQPELEKLHEKYKDDLATYNREKTRLMMKNGMNPFTMLGGCVLLLAQSPIMMGLYFGLQESIFFRLEPFLWINNLAAPDMTLWWGEHVPWISSPDNIGSFIYLGPYLNVLPLVAVGIMMYQQAKMMPPPTDEQMASQQRMMKFMMGVMALFFYKVAAGLALYFIISTSWAIIERRLIKRADDAPPPAGNGSEILPTSPNGTPAEQKPLGRIGRFRETIRKRLEEVQKQAAEQSSRQIRNDKPGSGGNRGGKKKRRK